MYRIRINQMDGRRHNGVGCLRFIFKDYYSLFMWNQLIIDTLITTDDECVRFWQIEWNSFESHHRIPLNALFYNGQTPACSLSEENRTKQNEKQ